VLAIFVIGIVARRTYLSWLERHPEPGRRLSVPLLVALLVPSVLLLFRIERASFFQHWVWFVGFDIALVVLALPALLYAARPVESRSGRLSAIAVWFGERSYGIYLWHFPIILSVYGRGAALAPPTLSHWWLRLVIIVTASVAFGAASYRMVEHPARELGRRLGVMVTRRRPTSFPRGGIA
jgi:peptidoglycan/LPS O-acetylase OafA/YrhL